MRRVPLIVEQKAGIRLAITEIPRAETEVIYTYPGARISKERRNALRFSSLPVAFQGGSGQRGSLISGLL